MSDALPRVHKSSWDAIWRLLRDGDRFLLTTHVNPDGDGLGAELGLAAALRSTGKDVRIVNQDPLPERYRFLETEGVRFEAYDPDVHTSVLADREVVIVLDLSRRERLGAVGAALRDSPATVVCVDHHPFEDDELADLYGVDTTAAATGLLAYECALRADLPVERDAALGFYVSLLTDTGSFRFSNTDARAHHAAAELVATGLRPDHIHEQVYGGWPLSRLRLYAALLDSVDDRMDGRFLLLQVSDETLQQVGAAAEDADGVLDLARSVAGCDVVALLVERPDSVKISLRSRGDTDVRRIAMELGGGGHRYAAGATRVGSLADAVRAVQEAVEPRLGQGGE